MVSAREFILWRRLKVMAEGVMICLQRSCYLDSLEYPDYEKVRKGSIWAESYINSYNFRRTSTGLNMEVVPFYLQLEFFLKFEFAK